MTTVQSAVVVKPTRPWLAKPSQRLQSVGVFLLALAISYGVVAVTPMKGKLAYAAIFFIVFTALDYLLSYFTLGKSAAKDVVARGFIVSGMVIVTAPILSILVTVLLRGYKGIHASMFTTDMRASSMNDPVASGGLMHALIGTFLMVAIALVISVPLGILTALYLTEIRGRFTKPIAFLVQAMSGVPSIVAGLFILSALIYTVAHAYSGIMGSLALSILMIPTIARTSEEVLLLIPPDLREAGVALGGTQWRTVALVVVPAARSGLVTAMILGIARVAGETAPLLLVAGGSDQNNLNPFHGPMASLPYYVWKAYSFGSIESVRRAWAGILVLLVIVLVLFTAARFLSARKGK